MYTKLRIYQHARTEYAMLNGSGTRNMQRTHIPSRIHAACLRKLRSLIYYTHKQPPPPPYLWFNSFHAMAMRCSNVDKVSARAGVRACLSSNENAAFASLFLDWIIFRQKRRRAVRMHPVALVWQLGVRWILLVERCHGSIAHRTLECMHRIVACVLSGNARYNVQASIRENAQEYSILYASYYTERFRRSPQYNIKSGMIYFNVLNCEMVVSRICSIISYDFQQIDSFCP